VKIVVHWPLFLAPFLNYLALDVTASKGWFTDSHERVDVVESSVRILEHMAELEPRMRFYRGDDLSIEIPRGDKRSCLSDA
jgi:hypothetical protein